MRGDPASPVVWFSIALRDLEKAKRDFASGDIPYALVNLQQAAEKALKGKLLSVGWGLRKVHDCAALAHELSQRGCDVTWFAEAGAVLRDEYFAERYPGWSDPPPSNEELVELIEAVDRLFAELGVTSHPGR